MSLNLDETYVISIANDLLYLEDFLPPKINGILALQKDLNFNQKRGEYLQKHPKIIQEMREHRIEVFSQKTFEKREEMLEQQVIDFIDKYPQWDKII
ncbi:MAG: hypothetical protein ISP01_07215 [Methanobrevibacter arboriphilus]|uniref:Uncharacterized protein n=1 Tax=Methanobrevibacter arboriphilus TaxID=39441 RepID=A0A843AR04_METAZ|nr:hypothetical protein [Methanobrevibacter arboriphilus]MBF4469180.1 hypothetical protein [Methanobrevibacter arboriphilus]